MAAGTAPQAVFQEPVTFEDVAVYFSAEEWRGLAGWQRGLYREMMMENYQLIASLGSAGPKPEVVLKLERGEEPHLGDPLRPREGARKPPAQRTPPGAGSPAAPPRPPPPPRGRSSPWPTG
ncbi:zinc finger protein 707-like isoform X2 [Ciconia boyciana]|uniref:zinc finger protein 707-like isoform X2 n=1 Tax=Ciconia boyciana TaxID=52775 RepID=UPI003BA116D5